MRACGLVLFNPTTQPGDDLVDRQLQMQAR